MKRSHMHDELEDLQIRLLSEVPQDLLYTAIIVAGTLVCTGIPRLNEVLNEYTTSQERALIEIKHY